MNPIAKEMNAVLDGTVAGALLSDLGKRMYFPRGIVAQSAEAKKHAKVANATIGMALRQGKPVYLDAIRSLVPGLEPDEIFPYAPTQGVEKLREAWKKEIIQKNPDIGDTPFSLPLVVPGLTAGISTLADLFCGPGDTLVIPDLYWDNYPLIFETRREAFVKTFPFYTQKGGFNAAGLQSALGDASRDGKVVLLLNFPNNPTGYSPSREEAGRIVSIIGQLADSGKRLLVITDDAYFGLFYEAETYPQSLFARLAGLHENVLAAKIDGSTKEDLTWGFRTAFISLAARGLGKEHHDALINKLMGAVRSTVSNSSVLAQNLILRAIANPARPGEKEEAAALLRERYRKVKAIVADRASKALQPYPFNSGYFMSFRLARGNAETLRTSLLMEEGVGTVAVNEQCLRVAFSQLDVDKLETVYELIYKTAERVLK
ncbi:MAG TPA: aminotransferase class I/II-fold pyridoxal phosphate-dependent enzyme [Spirochaetia bacterium]|nr:aminotransferase class I/II-fold pyridoxal phosphate-dependent enzyme [Spirochaetia bacterium]